MKGKQKLSRWEKIQYSSALSRFTVLGVSILIVEVTLGCWPVVATSIWGRHAVDTWIHFTYWVKAFWLFLAVFQSWCAPWKFKLLEKQLHQTRYIDLETQEEYRKHERKESLGFFRFFLGATASCELEAWMMISIFFHALLSFIILILVLVLKHEIASNTHWVLSVIFDAVAILESIGSPYVLTTFGVGPIMDTDPIFPETMVPPAPQYFVPPTTTTTIWSLLRTLPLLRFSSTRNNIRTTSSLPHEISTELVQETKKETKKGKKTKTILTSPTSCCSLFFFSNLYIIYTWATCFFFLVFNKN